MRKYIPFIITIVFVLIMCACTDKTESSFVAEDGIVIYGQPYRYTEIIDGEECSIDFVFYKDGSGEIYHLYSMLGDLLPEEYATYKNGKVYENEKVVFTSEDNGKRLRREVEVNGKTEYKYAELIECEPQGIQFGKCYVNQEEKTFFVCYEDGSGCIGFENEQKTFPAQTLTYSTYEFYGLGAITCQIHPDGTKIIVNGMILEISE